MTPSWLLVVWMSLPPGLEGSNPPRSCVLDSKVLICKSLNFDLQQLYTFVTYDPTIKFLFIKTTDPHCSCRVIELMKLLRVTGVTMVTGSPCQLDHLKACNVDLVVSNPQLVAGLVVSKNDPRRKFAIKYHVSKLWRKIKDMEHVGLKTSFYRSIIRDVQEELKELHNPQKLFPESDAASVEDHFFAVSRDTTRQTSLPSLVPYRAYAGGQFYSLYDTAGIRLALPRQTQKPYVRRTFKPLKRFYVLDKPMPRKEPVFKPKITVPVETTTVTQVKEIPTQPREKFLSPAEIRRMTRESDHRMKSFIIFFVAITGIITVIAVLLIMAMRSTGDSREKSRLRHLHANCQCCDQRRMEQECLLNDYEDTMHRRCPLFHYYQGAQQCPPSTCLMGQVMKQVSPAGPNEKATQTEGRCHPVLGGRHVVTEFEAWCQDHDATYKPPGLNWSVGCGGQFIRDDDPGAVQGGSAIQNMATLPCMNGTNRNVNRPAGNINNSSPLVSFLDSIVKEKDGVIREYHRDQFNVKRHRRRQQYQAVLHPHAPGSRRSSVPPVKKRQKSIVRTNSSSDTSEPVSRKTSSKVKQ